MTGSSLAPIIIPMVVTFGLAAWIFLVYHAASHPLWHNSQAREQASTQPIALAARRPARPATTPHRRAA